MRVVGYVLWMFALSQRKANTAKEKDAQREQNSKPPTQKQIQNNKTSGPELVHQVNNSWIRSLRCFTAEAGKALS